jgi:uncharacterized protein YdbL (DUF1318 family)
MRSTQSLIWLMALGLCFLSHLHADDLADRMSSRRPAIESLKNKGHVGENNAGYLTWKGPSDAKGEALVQAQNADRKQGYQKVANSKGASVVQIAKIRASTYASRAKKGHWIQRANGAWVKK